MCAVTGTYTGDSTCANNPASVGPDVGTFPIAPVVSGSGQANFEITLTDGSYTISKALVTATAGSGSGSYNGEHAIVGGVRGYRHLHRRSDVRE